MIARPGNGSDFETIRPARLDEYAKVVPNVCTDRAEGSVITADKPHTGAATGAILSLVFEPGRRPDAASLLALGDGDGPGTRFTITHMAPAEDGWVELLASGLTFDCAGLAGGPPGTAPPAGTLLGLLDAPAGETLTLAAGPHLDDAPGMQPVIRTLAGIGVRLCTLPGVLSAVWRPAQAWMTPVYFQKVVGKWLAGGPFPALGLTTLERAGDGAIYTRGLALMTGQELRFSPDARLGAADVARIAVRLVHALIDADPVVDAHQFTGPDGETIDVAPMADPGWLRVSVRR